MNFNKIFKTHKQMWIGIIIGILIIAGLGYGGYILVGSLRQPEIKLNEQITFEYGQLETSTPEDKTMNELIGISAVMILQKL